jgi:hypothetical protein
MKGLLISLESSCFKIKLLASALAVNYESIEIDIIVIRT